MLIGIIHFLLYYINVDIIKLYNYRVINNDHFNDTIEQLENSINEFKHNDYDL